MAESTTASNGRRLLPSTAGEFVSRGGRWTPAMTPKMTWTIEIIDAETGEQRMIGKHLLDANGKPVFEPNPAAERMIKQNYPDLGYMPTAEFPEPKQDRRVQELEETVTRLESVLLGKVKLEDLPVIQKNTPKAATRLELLEMAKRELEQKATVKSPSVSSGVGESASRTVAVGTGQKI